MKVFHSHRAFSCAIFFLLLILAVPLSASASINFEILSPIKVSGSRPTDLAVSANGTVYAVDARANRITVHGPDHNYSGALKVEQPTAVAVDHGTIYVGSGDDLSVKILNQAGQTIGHLGKGAKEFKLPKNICIDPITKNIYVVDQLDHAIKVYSRTGAYLRKIDDTPNQPLDVTIVGSEVFVLDQPLFEDSEGRQKRGSRIQVFDMHGSRLRSFGSAADDQEYGFLRPKAVTSDSFGIIYVTDAYYGAVLSFDTAGTFVQLIEDPAKSGTGSVGVAVDDLGRLLVSSPMKSRMNVFQLGARTASVSTDSPLQGEDEEVPLTTDIDASGSVIPASTDHDSVVVASDDQEDGATSEIGVQQDGTAASGSTMTGSGISSSQATTLYIAEVDDSENDPFYNIVTLQNLANTSHTVKVLAYDPDGALVATFSKKLPAAGVVRLRPAGMDTAWQSEGNSITGKASFHGSLIIESSQPLAATTLFSASTGAFSLLPSGTPMQTMNFPHIDDNLLDWQTHLAIQNIYESRQSVTITVYDSQGRMAGSEIVVLGAHAHYEMQPSSILGSNWMNTYNNGERSISGTLEVICNNDPLVGQVTYRHGNPLDGMTMFSSLQGETELYFPIIRDMAGDYPEISGPFNDLILTSPTAQTITYAFYSYEGVPVPAGSGQLTFTSPNQTLYLSPAQLTGKAAGSSFEGVLRISATDPVIAMNQVQHLGDATVAGANSFAIELPAQPATKLAFPEVFDGALGWSSTISIQNTTGKSHPVTVDAFREDGSSYSFSVTVPANGAYRFSPGQSKAASLTGINGYFQGAIAISSEQPVAAALQYGHAPEPGSPGRFDNLEMTSGIEIQ